MIQPEQYLICQQNRRKSETFELIPEKVDAESTFIHKSLDYEKRVIFAQSWLDLKKDAHIWLIATNKAYFYLTESINKQNNRMWLNERPEDWIEKPLHDVKVLAWCAISCRKIYGPYFFEEMVNQHTYLDMLNFFFCP